jgi:glycerate 2-kinase
MGFITNFSQLAHTPEREKVLTLVESGLTAIQPSQVMHKHFGLQESILHVQDQVYDLTLYDNVFLIGFGKGSGGIAKIIEETLGEHLTDGYVIDNIQTIFKKIHFTKGTHPFPSQTNLNFTKTVLEKTQNMTEKDLVLVVICGGGSAMFEYPASVDLQTLTNTFKALLESGATISEMNIIRKHLSLVKGGGFAKHLYPATVVSLLFSDVPGNDMHVIASGPTVKDTVTVKDVLAVLSKYHITTVTEQDFIEIPKDEKYFENVHNVIMVSNMTALTAMQEKAKVLGLSPRIFSDRVEGNAKEIGKKLIAETKKGEVLLAGGETTVHVTGKGRGGRNQEVVLASLSFVDENTIVLSWDSDGIDFDTFAGAIGDKVTLKKEKELGLNAQSFLQEDNALVFWEKTGDGIITGKLESNVSDLFLIYKYA